MRKAGLWAACVGLLWAANASAVPVYYSYGYFGEGRSYANGDQPTFTFTMEYDLDRQPTYVDASGNVLTRADEGLHTSPTGPWFGYYHFDYFHAALVGASDGLDIDLSTALNRTTSFRQIDGPPGPVPTAWEDVVRWESGDYFINLIRFPGVFDAPIGSIFPLIADVYLGPTMVCPGRCGESLHLLAVSNSNIPEPATLGLLLIGAGLAVGMRRKHKGG